MLWIFTHRSVTNHSNRRIMVSKSVIIIVLIAVAVQADSYMGDRMESAPGAGAGMAYGPEGDRALYRPGYFRPSYPGVYPYMPQRPQPVRPYPYQPYNSYPRPYGLKRNAEDDLEKPY